MKSTLGGLMVLASLLLAGPEPAEAQSPQPADSARPVPLTPKDVVELHAVVSAPGFAEALRQGALTPLLGGKTPAGFADQLGSLMVAIAVQQYPAYKRSIQSLFTTPPPNGSVARLQARINEFEAELERVKAAHGSVLPGNLDAVDRTPRQCREIPELFAAAAGRARPPSVPPPAPARFGWPAGTPSGTPDFQVDTHETVLQEFVRRLGPVGFSGKQTASVDLPGPGWGWKKIDKVSVPYPYVAWFACDASHAYSVEVDIGNIRIASTGIPFQGKAAAEVSADLCGVGVRVRYDPRMGGELGATWDAAAEQINFEMQKVAFEIYVTLPAPFDHQPARVTLGYADVASFFPKPLFVRKIALSQTHTLLLPGNTSRTMTLTPLNASLSLNDGFLRVSGDLSFQ